MDESRIPFWLMVLWAITSISLAVWQSERCKPRVRQGALGLALLYFAFLAYAVGGDPRAISVASTHGQEGQAPELVMAAFGAVCVTSAALLSTHPGLSGQLTWFLALSLGNAGICFLTSNTDVAWALLVIAAGVAAVLFARWRRGGSFPFSEFVPIAANPTNGKQPYIPWLTGATGFLVGLVLIGTSQFAVRAETARATASPRYSTLPSQSRIRSVLADYRAGEGAGLIDLACGSRADVVVLLGVLAFVTLASTMLEKKEPTP